MTVKQLFDKINKLNKINKELGVIKQYGIKIQHSKSYYNGDWNRKVYPNLKTLLSIIEEETYYEDTENKEINIIEEVDDILNTEYTVTLSYTDRFNLNVIEDTFYVYIDEI